MHCKISLTFVRDPQLCSVDRQSGGLAAYSRMTYVRTCVPSMHVCMTRGWFNQRYGGASAGRRMVG